MRKVLILQQGARRDEVVRQGEGCFVAAKPKPKQRGPLGFTKVKANLCRVEGEGVRQGKATLHPSEGKTQQKTTLGFASTKKPSPRRRMSSWNSKPRIFSPSLAHFLFAYKYMYFRFN